MLKPNQDDLQIILNESVTVFETQKLNLSKLCDDMLVELKNMKIPPHPIKIVLEAVMVILHKDIQWISILKEMGTPGFMKQLQDVQIQSITKKTLTHLRRYILDPILDQKVVGKVSYFCRELVPWVQAVYKYRAAQEQLKQHQEIKEEPPTMIHQELPELELADMKAPEKLAAPQSIVNKINIALTGLTDGQMAEIKRYSVLSGHVLLTLEAVMLLLGRDVDEKSIKAELNRPHFLKRLKELDYNSVSKANQKRLLKYIDNKEFDPKFVGHQSLVCKSLCTWTRAVFELLQARERIGTPDGNACAEAVNEKQNDEHKKVVIRRPKSAVGLQSRNQLLDSYGVEEESVQRTQAPLSEDEKAQIELKLNQNRPILYQALAALDCLEDIKILELKHYKEFNGPMLLTLQAVMILLDKPSDSGLIRHEVIKNSFMKSLVQFDRNKITSEQMKHLKPFIENPDFDPHKVEKQSTACKALCEWVCAIYTFKKVSDELRPHLREASRLHMNELVNVLQGAYKPQSRQGVVKEVKAEDRLKDLEKRNAGLNRRIDIMLNSHSESDADKKVEELKAQLQQNVLESSRLSASLSKVNEK